MIPIKNDWLSMNVLHLLLLLATQDIFGYDAIQDFDLQM